MKSTIISRRCYSNSGNCPTNDKAFLAAIRSNGNWAVIDRKMQKCVSVWDALRGRNEEEIAAKAAVMLPQVREPSFLIQQFRDVAQKVWHLRVLNLLGLCAEVKPDEGIRAQCKHLEE